ncbi:MAG: hypothetical protein K1X57_11520 [Gemmataceae bacterium]|nr:hypothetical protein [Gemmataceae bacterium]
MAGKLALTLCVMSVIACPASGQIRDGGKDPTVTADQVVRLRLDHYDAGDRKSHAADFEWTFSKEEFVIKKGKGAIPADLLKKLLHTEAADEIRGKWALDKGGQTLVFTQIKAGQTAGKKEVRMAIVHTGVGVFRLGDPEYVFGLKDK